MPNAQWRQYGLLAGLVIALAMAACDASFAQPSADPESSSAEESAMASDMAHSDAPQASSSPDRDDRTFGDGDHIVGSDIRPGTYRIRDSASLCYWERLSGFGGTLGEIIANGSGSGFFTVTIKKGDAGFSSSGCGTWTTDLSAVVPRRGPIDDEGVFIVGTDVAPGTWRSSGGGGFGCYAARLSGFSGALGDVIANDLSTDGGLVITIQRSDKGFETNGCGTWTKVD